MRTAGFSMTDRRLEEAIRHLDGLRDIHDVREEFFSAPYPVSTLVQVAALVEPDLLIEVTATAIVAESRYRAPEAIQTESFVVSDEGFNI